MSNKVLRAKVPSPSTPEACSDVLQLGQAESTFYLKMGLSLF